MRIGLYGMPTAGKSYILDKVDFLEVMSGSVLLREICPTFDSEDDHGKNMAREELAKRLLGVESFIMDGHYAFGDKVAFTDMDGRLYDVILYLYISPDVLIKRMRESDKNKKYLSYDIEKWQMNEMESLRDYCHKSNKDFYVIDNPKDNYFTDVTEVVEFIKAIVNGFSCKRLAADCVEKILSSTDSEVITLLDGDKTVTKEDSSHAVFGYTTHIYDGNFYTGFQSWRQAEEFKSYSFDDLKELPVGFNEKVCKALNKDSYILTSGHERVWRFIADYLGVPFFAGIEMSAETKFFITKKLQEAGKTVIAYGDGMNDYYMLKKADVGYLIPKEDGTISRSLKGKDLGGLDIVRT